MRPTKKAKQLLKEAKRKVEEIIKI